MIRSKLKFPPDGARDYASVELPLLTTFLVVLSTDLRQHSRIARLVAGTLGLHQMANEPATRLLPRQRMAQKHVNRRILCQDALCGTPACLIDLAPSPDVH